MKNTNRGLGNTENKLSAKPSPNLITINVGRDNWKKLQYIKIRGSMGSIDEVLTYLLFLEESKR